MQGWFMTHKAFVLMKKVHLLMDKVTLRPVLPPPF